MRDDQSRDSGGTKETPTTERIMSIIRNMADTTTSTDHQYLGELLMTQTLAAEETVLSLLVSDLKDAGSDLRSALRRYDHSPNARNKGILNDARAKADALLDIYLEEKRNAA